MSRAIAIRKIEIAIDKVIDIVDEGYGCDKTARILEMLRELENELLNRND